MTEKEKFIEKIRALFDKLNKLKDNEVLTQEELDFLEIAIDFLEDNYA